LERSADYDHTSKLAACSALLRLRSRPPSGLPQACALSVIIVCIRSCGATVIYVSDCEPDHGPGTPFHDLLRAYATDLTYAIDPDQQRHAATQRILDHYLYTAHTAGRLLNPTGDPITLSAPEPAVTPECLT